MNTLSQSQDDTILELKASAVALTEVAKRLKIKGKRGDARVVYAAASQLVQIVQFFSDITAQMAAKEVPNDQ